MKRTNFRPAVAVSAILTLGVSGGAAWAETANAACNATLMSGQIAQHSATHATVHTSILIDAPADEVWTVLTDFDAMASWSSDTLQTISGEIKDGGSVVVTFIYGVDDAGAPVVNEIPHTLIYEEGTQFGWSDPFPEAIGGGHDNHLYRVEACGEQTLFVQSDAVVANAYAANIVSNLLPLYQVFNADLKAAVEN